MAPRALNSDDTCSYDMEEVSGEWRISMVEIPTGSGIGCLFLGLSGDPATGRPIGRAFWRQTYFRLEYGCCSSGDPFVSSWGSQKLYYFDIFANNNWTLWRSRIPLHAFNVGQLGAAFGAKSIGRLILCRQLLYSNNDYWILIVVGRMLKYLVFL